MWELKCGNKIFGSNEKCEAKLKNHLMLKSTKFHIVLVENCKPHSKMKSFFYILNIIICSNIELNVLSPFLCTCCHVESTSTNITSNARNFISSFYEHASAILVLWLITTYSWSNWLAAAPFSWTIREKMTKLGGIKWNEK